MKIVKAIAIIEAELPLRKTLKTALNYAAVTWWAADNKIYILNCSLHDAAVFCKQALKTTFLWGEFGASMAKYKIGSNNSPEFLRLSKDSKLPKDCLSRTHSIISMQEFEKSLDDNRTFLSRALHRRLATA